MYLEKAEFFGPRPVREENSAPISLLFCRFCILTAERLSTRGQIYWYPVVSTAAGNITGQLECSFSLSLSPQQKRIRKHSPLILNTPANSLLQLLTLERPSLSII